MKLTIANKQIALAEKTKISIERSSPLMNDDTGSYSFPFPVPTLPNQQNLGWPGRLQREGDIPDQPFILEDLGLQVFRGEVSYDDVTANEIGVILQSGFTEFTKKMEGKMLRDLNYGGESWPIPNGQFAWTPAAMTPIISAINNKLTEWNTANTANNGKYVVAPFFMNRPDATAWGGVECVNGQVYDNSPTGKISYLGPWYGIGQTAGYGYQEVSYSLSFYVSFVLRKIFENAGYTITEDNFSESEFNTAIMYSMIIHVAMSVEGSKPVSVIPAWPSLEYNTLMPGIGIIDFLNLVKDMFCIMYEIDELKKEVKIRFKKNVFFDGNLDGLKMVELAGWKHNEQRTTKGFTLRYKAQTNELDTHTEYPDFVVLKTVLPTPTVENEIVVSKYNRLYITIKNDNDSLEWKEVGRLKEVKAGEGENAKELSVNVPPQTTYVDNGLNFECPSIMEITKGPAVPTRGAWGLDVLNKPSLSSVDFLAISLYHGRKPFTTINYPYTSFDQFSRDGGIDTGMSLKPAYLYDKVYKEFLNWQTYRARLFTKYIELSLAQLLDLQWGKRYTINEGEVILNIIRYDLPYKGQVEIEGYTV